MLWLVTLCTSTLSIADVQAGSASADADISCADSDRLLPDRPAPLGQLQTDLAWTVTAGAGVTVAVVDSGVDQANPHLAGAMAPSGTDLVPDPVTTARVPPPDPAADPAAPAPPPPPVVDPGHDGYADTSGHGTVVAGIVAARPLEGSGVVGLAPAATILPVRVYAADTERADEQGTGLNPARTAQGIVYAADHGAQVIVVALSFPDDDPALAAAVVHATQQGSLVVASTGNQTPAKRGDPVPGGPRWPAASPGALGVAATDADGLPGASVPGPHVAVSAPAHAVVAPANGGQDCAYTEVSTSWATAYVAGAAALVAAAHPDESPAQWAYRLTASAVRADPDHRTDDLGWGIVQPYDAMVLVPGSDVRGPPNPFTGTTVEPVTAHHDALTTTPTGAPWNGARRTAALVAVVAVVVLSTIGPLLLARSQRRPTTPALPATGGLYAPTVPTGSPQPKSWVAHQ
ncbi:MAG: S8 family serine peptidase [Micrococcales bacterium]|nr:S8 family serine peptidase [Micrococcales bacterium]MCL2666978.1 S8 family serine peptidase [Micrococcales bacterium]